MLPKRRTSRDFRAATVAATVAAIIVLGSGMTSCTRTVRHAAVPERDFTFDALSDLYDGPWAQGVPAPPADVAGEVAAPSDAPAPIDPGGGEVAIPTANPPNMPKAPPPAAAGGRSAPDPNNPILATIRQLESGNNYKAQAPGSSASGAYQILNEVWAGFGGFGRAADAPPSLQDTKAAQLIIAVLSPKQDVSRVPVAWYIGHVPPDGSPEWNRVPAPSAGNVLTPRQYQTKWLAIYDQKWRASQGGSS